MNFKKIITNNDTAPTQTIKRQWYSKKEREHYIKLWQESGLSQVDFCAEHNLNLKNFYRWRTSLRELKSKGSESNQTPLTKEPNFCIKCQLPNGANLLFTDIADASALCSILKGVSECRFN